MVDYKSGLSIPGRGHILCKGPGAWGLYSVSPVLELCAGKGLEGSD